MSEVTSKGEIIGNGVYSNGSVNRFEDSPEYRAAFEHWQRHAVSGKTTGMKYTTLSGNPVEMLYTPKDETPSDYLRDLGFPGDYPYTSGIHPNGYRGKL